MNTAQFYIPVTTEWGVLSHRSSFSRSLSALLFLTLTDHFTASFNSCESTLQLSFRHSFSLFISRFLGLFQVFLPSWTETERVLSLTLLTQHEKTSLSSKALLQCYNNRCNGHHDTMNLSSVYCVCWTITDRLGDRWTDGWSSWATCGS